MNINVYNHEMFGSIRKIVMDDGVLWLVAKDVANALEYGNIRQAISMFVNPLDRNSIMIDSPAGPRKTTVINMKGVYDLCLHSRLPKAQEFQYWITHEVVPEIQQYGMYIGENADFAQFEYDEYGRLKVIEVDTDGLLKRIDEYKNEIVEVRNEMARKKEEYEKELFDLDMRLQMARHHMQSTHKFSIDSVGYPCGPGAFNLEYPIMILIKNFVDACEQCGFKKDYGMFLHYLVDLKKICCFYIPEKPNQELCRVYPNVEAFNLGYFSPLEFDPWLQGRWFEFTPAGIEEIIKDVKENPELIEVSQNIEKYEEAIEEAAKRIDAQKPKK